MATDLGGPITSSQHHLPSTSQPTGPQAATTTGGAIIDCIAAPAGSSRLWSGEPPWCIVLLFAALLCMALLGVSQPGLGSAPGTALLLADQGWAKGLWASLAKSSPPHPPPSPHLAHERLHQMSDSHT
jgi:hypothetical protein